MIYDLSKEVDRKQFSTKVSHYWERGKAGEVIRVELKQKRKKRTIRQNAYLHLLFSWFAMKTGYTAEEVKQDIFKRDVCKDFFIKNRNNRIVYRSTSDLSTLEMTNAIDKFKNWSAKEAGIYLPDANDESFMNYIEDQISRYGNRQYI
jgi:Ser-tRNA(Ala) deacylase AlaX